MSEESRFQPIVDAAALDQVLKATDRVTVVKFWATWCGPCKMMAPRLETLAADTPNVDFHSLDAGELTAESKAVGVVAVPTLFAIRKGGERVAFTGPMAVNQLTAWLKVNAA